MYYTVYLITNKINGKSYIGKHQTKDLDDGYMGSGKLIRAAIEKYGSENFEKTILFTFNTEEEMNLKEKELVTEDFCSSLSNYNICPGGKGGFGYINKNVWTKERRLEQNRKNLIKALAARKGKLFPHSQKTKEKLSKIMKGNKSPGMSGKNHHNETKRKMSENGSGEKNSQYGTMWITNGSDNKKTKKVDKIPDGWYKGRVFPIDSTNFQG